jgi:hypothetical protein
LFNKIYLLILLNLTLLNKYLISDSQGRYFREVSH